MCLWTGKEVALQSQKEILGSSWDKITGACFCMNAFNLPMDFYHLWSAERCALTHSLSYNNPQQYSSKN